MKFQPQMDTDKHGFLNTLRAGVQLDTVPGWLPLNRFLRFKAKYENESFPMNLHFNWARLVPVYRIYSQLVVTTALILTFSPGRRDGDCMRLFTRWCVVRIQSWVLFRFRDSMREFVGGNLTPTLSPFCYRKTRRGRHAPSVFLNQAIHHSWPQTRTVSRCILPAEVLSDPCASVFIRG
jgi:hypothetical protein